MLYIYKILHEATMINQFWHGFNNGFLTGMIANIPFFGCFNYFNNFNYNFFNTSFGYPMLPQFQYNTGSVFNFNANQTVKYQQLDSMNYNFNACFDTFSSMNSSWNMFTAFSTNWGSFPSGSFSNSKASSNVSCTASLPTCKRIVDVARSYVGKINSDKAGNKAFSKGQDRPWCADFVGYVVNRVYGSRIKDFPQLNSVNNIRSWGIKHDCYLRTDNSFDKAMLIKNKVKPGDIMIEKRGDKSHTGFVCKVYQDGSFDTVEGNCSDSVGIRHYKANSPTLSGFVRMNEYMA